MRGSAGRLLIAFLLTLAAAACIAELSGRWDQTLPDANDEVGLVAIVLCVGAGIAIAARLTELTLAPLRPMRVIDRAVASTMRPRAFIRIPLATSSPPTALRI